MHCTYDGYVRVWCLLSIEAHQPAGVALEHQLAAARPDGLQVHHILDRPCERMLCDEAVGSLMVGFLSTL